ncbi:organic cation/carnitine transporter 2-like [Engraulis encrasicolus]|uniref:organic cation/carnitine transporter 2-like n=1 Tax=Engraulis encrasicolus TaxID=184585 RepID=UPI002FD1216E
MKDYEEAIEFLGVWGPFQRLTFIVLSLNVIPNGYLPLSMVFLGDISPHHCRVPFLNSSYGGLGYNLSIPTEELKGEIILSRCRRYTEKKDSYSAYSNDTEGCVDGWVFSKERYVSTIVTEWNLVCDDAWKAPFPATAFFFGELVSSFVSGILSDRYGRKITFFSAKVLQILLGFLLAVSTSWEMFCVLYFALGVASSSLYCTGFVLGAEILIKSARETFGSMGFALFFGIGYAIMPVLSYFNRDWRTLQIVLSVVVVFIFTPLFWYIPESPRWLITQGRLNEAEAIIRAAAKRNGITSPEKIFQLEHIADTKESENESNNQKKYTWLDLIKTANVRNITVLNIIIWLAISVGFYGLSLNFSNMDGDLYRNNLLSASMDILGNVFVWFAIHYAPHRVVLPFSLLVEGALLLLILFVPQELSGVTITLALIGRLVVAGAFAFAFVYATELFPTVIRNMGLSAASAAARIGSAVSPYVAHTSTYNKTLPFILMGTLSIFSGGLSLLLPETKDEKLPELISQVKPLQCCCLKIRFDERNIEDGHVDTATQTTGREADVKI